MEKVQKRSNPVCYTPSSEPFRIKNIVMLYSQTHVLQWLQRNEPDLRKCSCPVAKGEIVSPFASFAPHS
jgi:hypothetical protein